MNKKSIIITAAVTSVAVFILTTIFYNLPIGRYMYSDISRLFGNTDFSKFIKMETIIESEFMGEYNKTRLVDYAAKGYAGALNDEYTEYLDRDEYKSVNDNLNGGYKGIGVKVSKSENKIYIHSVQKDGPADRADIITNARREADGIIRSAEERAKAMVAQEEITKLAQEKATSWFIEYELIY